MQLSSAQKEKLLSTSESVYKGYVALDFFKTQRWDIKADEAPLGMSLMDLCQRAIANKELDQTVTLNGSQYTLQLIPDGENSYRIALLPALSFEQGVRKPFKEYTQGDIVDLLRSQSFSITVVNDELALSNDLCVNNKTVTIGGPGKVDLYRTHLWTLNNIIEKINGEEDISALLVALATGSGKTFVQALWALVLYLSDNNAVFALPDKLVNQFKRDLCKLLPNALVDSFLTLRENQENPDALTALDAFSNPEGTGQIVIASSENLLDNHYQQISAANPNTTFLAFDEQHLLMKQESRRVRLSELSKSFLSMFLTATPTKETYVLAGSNPVALMSSGRKEAEGQGRFPKLYTEKTQNVSDENKLRNFKFWTPEFWKKVRRGLVFRLFNIIQEENSSAALSIVDNLPFYLHRIEQEPDSRWALQAPAARKMLCIIDNNEDLVNFCHALQRDENLDQLIYRNGNIVDRRVLADFFMADNEVRNVMTEKLHEKRAQYQAQLKAGEEGVTVHQGPLKNQIKHNIFHNMVEFVLMDLTGMDELEHNRLRKENPQALQLLIKQKYQQKTVEDYFNILKEKIDEAGAYQIAGILEHISAKIGDTINQDSPEDFNDYVDNWSLNTQLLDTLMTESGTFAVKFALYAENHLMMGLMTGMDKAEMPVKESAPFIGLTHKRYDLYDKQKGLRNPNTKKRMLSPVEVLNNNSKESRFEPQYCYADNRGEKSISEEQCDNYFRLGFVGVYVSNKKTEGFSDTKLHTVINISEQTSSSTNNPESVIQGIGRNRGLDETIIPAYIHALGRNQKSYFDLEHLRENDYYPSLFQSQKKYNKACIKVLGERLGKDIVMRYNILVEADGSIDSVKFKHEVLKLIAQALRELNNNNKHDIKLSRAQLTQVVNQAMKTLKSEINKEENPLNLGFGVKAIGNMLNAFYELIFSFKRFAPSMRITIKSWFGPSNQSEYDKIYIKILKSITYKKLVERSVIAWEFSNWIYDKSNGIKFLLQKNLAYYLQDNLQQSFEQHQEDLIWPLLSKFIVPEKREFFLQVIKNYPGKDSFLTKNKDFFKKIIMEKNIDGLYELLITMPGLADLIPADIMDFKAHIEDVQKQFAQGPFAILNQDPQLSQQMKANLASYLKGPFLEVAQAWFLDSDLDKLKSYLSEGENAQLFIEHLWLKKAHNKAELNDIKVVIAELKECAKDKLGDFDTLDARKDVCIQVFKIKVPELMHNVFVNLNDATNTEIALIFHQQIIPSLVNLFPLQDRERIVNAVTLEKIKELIRSEGASLINLLQSKEDPGLKASEIFKKLVDFSLPEPINIQEEVQQAKDTLEAKFSLIEKLNPIPVGLSALTSFSLWGKIIRNPKYVYAAPIQQILVSDDFINAMSLYMPFDQWQEFKTLMQDSSSESQDAVREIACELIDKKTSSTDNSLGPDFVLQSINKHFNKHYVSAQASIVTATTHLQEIATRIGENPDSALDAAVYSEFTSLVRDLFFPLLVKFIRDPSAKAQFLAHVPLDDKKIFAYLMKNKALFDQLQEGKKINNQEVALQLINELVPADIQLTEADIINVEEHAITQAKFEANKLTLQALTNYLLSTHFKTFVNDVFNPEDARLVGHFLEDQNNVARLAQKMLDQDLKALDENQALSLLIQESELENIKPLKSRISDTAAFIKNISAIDGKLLKMDKLSQLILDTFTPILFHKYFIATIDGIIGFLNESELTVMMRAAGDENPQESAAKLLRFIDLIRIKDAETLKNEFMSFYDSSLNLEEQIAQLPCNKMFEKLLGIIDEIHGCHSYYNRQTRTGMLDVDNSGGSLVQLLSPELADIRVKADENSNLDHSGRRIFFLQGVKNSSAKVSQIKASANEDKIKRLKRVHNHILRPVWWDISISQTSYAFSQAGKGIIDGFKFLGTSIANGFKRVGNVIVPNYFTISKTSTESKEYHESAESFTKTMNKLAGLGKEEVEEEECPSDTIQNLEESHLPKSMHQRFFKAPPTSSEAKEEQKQVQNQQIKR